MSKYAVITGASSGIGLEFARLIAEDGYDLLLVARDEKVLQKVSAELQQRHKNKIKVTVAALDLSTLDAADKLWRLTKNRHVDVLINNAGFGDLEQLVSADWEKLSSMIELNVVALTRLSQLAAQRMKSGGGGKILNLASIAAFFPGPGMATYYATKSYVLSFSEALAQELSGSGVYVTALCPGPTRTGFSTAAGAQNSGIFKGRLPSAKDVAEFGYKALQQHRIVAIHGIGNKLKSILLPRILPRSVVRKIISRMQK